MKTVYFMFMLFLMVDFVVFMQRLAYWVAMILDGRERLQKLPYGDKYDRTLKLFKRAVLYTGCWAVICIVTFCFYVDCVTQFAR